MSSTIEQTGEKEVLILAGLLGNGNRKLTNEIAHYIKARRQTEETHSLLSPA